MKILLLTVSLCSSCLVTAQVVVPDSDPGGGTIPNTSPPSSIDPIAIAAAQVLKGHTNREQRRAIRREWAIIAAQRTEDFLRGEAFKKILDFVERNRELFAEVYRAMQSASSVVQNADQVKETIKLQQTLFSVLRSTARDVQNVDALTAEELEVLTLMIENILDETNADGRMLLGLFQQTLETKFSDMERFELLKSINLRLREKVKALKQIRRYITFIKYSRSGNSDEVLPQLFKAQ